MKILIDTLSINDNNTINVMTMIHFSLLKAVIGIALAGVLAVISHKLKALTISGAFGALIIGAIIFGLGGWLYSIPLLFFFISSNILSRFKSEVKLKSWESIEKPGARDIKQVFANGGVATICVLLIAITSDSRWFYIYLASLGAATADTWATEIGTLFSGKPRSIISFKRVKPGESGGVSITGTVASLLGSTLTVYSVLPFVYNKINLHSLAFATLFGFAGSVIDSVLGATIQAGYRCEVCGRFTESPYHCGKRSKLIRGIRIINNDTVNLLSNLAAAILSYWLIF